MRLFDPELSRAVIRLAAPVVVSQVSQTVVGLVDTMMVGRLSVEALAATGLSGVAVWMVMGAAGHLATGTQIVVARRVGEGRGERAGEALRSALRLGLPGALVLQLALLWLFPLYYGWILGGADDPLRPICSAYTAWRLAGLVPFLLISALKGFFNGLGDTKQHMRVALAVNALNVLFNWVFIFGHLGAPALGAPGAGLASMLATAGGAALFVVQARRAGLASRWGFRWRDLLAPRPAAASEGPRRILRLSAPAMAQTFLVLAGFTGFMAMMNRVGTLEVAATNVIITILSFSFMPGFGIGIAASTLIGQLLGAGRPARALRAGVEAQKIGMALMGALGLLFIALPDALLGLFSDDPGVLAAGRAPLRVLGAIQAVDALGMVTAGCLEGAGLTLFVMAADVGVNWLFFLPATALAVFVFDSGILPPFFALAGYIALYAMILQWKYRRGDWTATAV